MRRLPVDLLLEDAGDFAPGYEWLPIAAHLERLAPEGTTVDEFARAEDAAAEWVYQRSLHRALAPLAHRRGQAPGST